MRHVACRVTVCRLVTAALLLAWLAIPAAWAAEEQASRVTLDFYRALAESGSADAQLTMGDRYRVGDGTPVDLIEAYAWYYLAAQQGVEEAIKPMNEVLGLLERAQWAAARQRAEEYERRFIPRRK